MRQIYLHDVYLVSTSKAVWWVSEVHAQRTRLVIVKMSRNSTAAKLGAHLSHSFEPGINWKHVGTAPDFDTAVAAAALGAFDD